MSAAMSWRPNYAREIRYALTDPRALCEALGLLAGKNSFQRQAGGLIVRCPWHDDRSPSCSVRVARDGTIAVRCHACGATGDALSLVAAVYGLRTASEFRQVLVAAAELAGLHGVARELETGISVERPEPTPPSPAPTPERDYPPECEVAALLGACIPVDEDVQVSTWLEGRGIRPGALESVAMALPPTANAPWWASFRRTPWTKTGHRLIVPMRDHTGKIRSVRAARVVDGDSPKRLPPGGHKASGLVMACDLATAMLCGTYRPNRVVISEGEPDFLSWATRPVVAARIGIVSGSWSWEFAKRFPAASDGEPCSVLIRTDADAAGTRYAQEIRPSLAQRGCFVSWTQREVSNARRQG